MVDCYPRERADKKEDGHGLYHPATRTRNRLSFQDENTRITEENDRPSDEKKFTNWISRSLGATNYIPTAKKLRDIRLAEIRAMEADAAKGEVLGDRFSLERATAWAETLSVRSPKAVLMTMGNSPNSLAV